MRRVAEQHDAAAMKRWQRPDEFGDIVTKATLADALHHALTRSGLKVTKADRA